MIHIVLHFVVPTALALLVYRDDWIPAAGVMIATMIVDVDHLLADPIYDPERCSIGFHPLHEPVLIALYAACAVLPLLTKDPGARVTGWRRILHLAGVGLVIHMALDGLDCTSWGTFA